jgi:hypothetical protein
MVAAQKQRSAYDGWSHSLLADMEANRFNGAVGTVLVSETDGLRIWHLRLAPGERCAFHRHVLDHFWTCHSHGTARGYFEGGRIADTTHYPGHTLHRNYGPGEYLLHSVENIGQTELLFTTVEFKQGGREPLPVPDEVRLKLPDAAAHD